MKRLNALFLVHTTEERLEREKILFVSTINQTRSATAEKIFENDLRYEVRSAGTNKNATVTLTEELLDWADVIVVMERLHKHKIKMEFPEVYNLKPIVCLYIEDHYEFMQKDLIYALEDKFEDAVERGFLKGSKNFKVA